MSLQKAAFSRIDLSGDTEKVIDTVEVLYNPTEFSLNKRMQYAEIGIPGLNAPIQQFVRGQAETLSVELFFDTTATGAGEQETVTPVTLFTDRFYQLIRVSGNRHAPPICRFSWGEKGFPGSNLSGSWSQGQEGTAIGRKNGFTGIIESVDQRFTLFSPQGVPLRAVITVRMREYRTLKAQVKATEETTTVKEGQTLDQLAEELYGDPGQWRKLAEANNIENPLADLTGSTLVAPS